MRKIGLFSLVLFLVAATLWQFELALDINPSSQPALSASAKSQAKPLNEVFEKAESKTSPPANKAKESQIQARSKELLACLKNETCHYPQTDPRSYSYALGGDMMKLLGQAESLLDRQALREICHSYLRVPNGHVQAKAIEILATLPVNYETLLVLNEVLGETFDSVLLSKSMPLLERYHQQTFSNEVDDLLLQQVQSGGHFVRQSLSAKVLPFLNDSNLIRYQQAALKLPQNSLEYQQLNAVLKEYQRIKRGG